MDGEKRQDYAHRASVDEPLLPPQYQEHISGLSSSPSNSDFERSDADLETLTTKPKKRLYGHIIIPLLIFGPGTLAALLFLLPNAFYNNGIVSNRPHANSASFPTE
jgi:hypothetical protein